MRAVIKYLGNIQEFNKTTIVIGNAPNCDFRIEELDDDVIIKLVYTEKYKNYVMVNVNNSKSVLYNNKPFLKVLVGSKFILNAGSLHDFIAIETDFIQSAKTVQNSTVKSANGITTVNTASVSAQSFNSDDIFNNDVEKHRIAIIKEIGYRITELKNTIRSLNTTALLLNASIFILSVVSAFGITNFLLGLKIDNSSSVLNLTTNVGFLMCISAIVLAVALVLKHGVYGIFDFNQNKKFGDSDFAQKVIVAISSLFMFIIYAINLFYYKDIPGFVTAAFFISLLFVGALAVVSVASGYFKFQLKNYNHMLTNSEYREDFESVMKSYRIMISTYVNRLSANKINNIKGVLLNNQLKMIVEICIGLATAPFLAYGVSNTLASCFPEAASWVRISGIRFSPIFLVLATFLIIFAFFSFVRAFTISKQVKGSEIIKFDGFHDYANHGVNVLGLDSMHALNREKNIVMFIACFIILIEFTMNVSYFVTEIGGDLQGLFLSLVTALVPTALLIAETHLLSSTMYKINNYNELLSMLD